LAALTLVRGYRLSRLSVHRDATSSAVTHLPSRRPTDVRSCVGPDNRWKGNRARRVKQFAKGFSRIGEPPDPVIDEVFAPVLPAREDGRGDSRVLLAIAGAGRPWAARWAEPRW